jgi:hypothetical protein
MPRQFYGGIETDKVRALGYGYADALAKHVGAGDEDHTPWPFRVDAKTGAILTLEEYGVEVIDPVRLNQALPTVTAYYILNREDPATVDRQWANHTGHLIDWVRQRLGRGPFLGAWAIDEHGTPGGVAAAPAPDLAATPRAGERSMRCTTRRPMSTDDTTGSIRVHPCSSAAHY